MWLLYPLSWKSRILILPTFFHAFSISVFRFNIFSSAIMVILFPLVWSMFSCYIFTCNDFIIVFSSIFKKHVSWIFTYHRLHICELQVLPYAVIYKWDAIETILHKFFELLYVNVELSLLTFADFILYSLYINTQSRECV